MWVYLTNIALIIFWRIFFLKMHFKNGEKIYSAIVALQWILVSGLRHWSVGSDTSSYAYSFEMLKEAPWDTLFSNIYNYLFCGLKIKDPGYPLLVKVFQLFSDDYQIFLILIATVFMSLLAVWIYRNSSSPCTSYILFSTLFYAFYAVTGHRQTLATALIVFVGYEQIKQRKLLGFLVVTLISFLLHKSALLFAPMYLIAMIPVSMPYMLLCGVIAVLISIFGKWLYGPIALWIGYGERQVNYAEGGAELYALLLIALCLVVWIQYPKFKKEREDADLLFHTNFMTLLTALLILQNQGFMRIQQYFSLFIMITIPEVLNTLRTDFRLIGYLIFGMVMILYLISNNPYYAFFFM